MKNSYTKQILFNDIKKLFANTQTLGNEVRSVLASWFMYGQY